MPAEWPDHLAGLAARHLAAFLVDQADVAALGRLADGVQLVGMQVRLEDAGAAAFGHAVELDQAAGPALEHVGLERRVEGRAGAELVVEARRDRELSKSGRAIRRWYCTGTSIVCVTRWLSASFRYAGRVELRHQQHAAAEGQGREEHDQRGVGVQRRRQQRDRARAGSRTWRRAARAPSACRGLARCPWARRWCRRNR